jgi:hypothetical protein
MLKVVCTVLASAAIVLSQTQTSLARGGGGGRGGAGRGFSGGGDNFRSGGESPVRGGEAGERTGDFSGSEREGFRDGNAGARERTNVDRGFGRGDAARDLTQAGHFTQKVSRTTLANQGRNVRDNFRHQDYFNRNWWNNHPGAWFAAGWAASTAWNTANWPALAAWYGWGTGQPVMYDYGSNVTYDDDEVYYGDSPVASADDYYRQASSVAASNPASSGPNDNWLPLGVFGLVQGDQTDPTAVFQLATNKSGAIQGNFSDVLTGSTLTVSGAVDPKSQRAAWTVGDKLDTVYETGISNLTRPEAPILVHIGKDRTQQWTLVRLQQPQGQQQ